MLNSRERMTGGKPRTILLMTWRVWLPTLLWCQFFLAEYLVSGSWRGAYSYRDDQISELGVKHCVNGGCNTSYWLMDISFVLVGMGLLFWAHPLWKAVETRSQAALFLAAGLGAVVGGAFPENNNWLIHSLGADVFCIFAPIGALFLCARCWHRLEHEPLRDACPIDCLYRLLHCIHPGRKVVDQYRSAGKGDSVSGGRCDARRIMVSR